MYLLAIVRAFIAIISIPIWMITYGITRLFLKHTHDSAFNLREHWIKYIAFPIFNIKVSYEGKIHDKPAVYVANHRSFVDPMVVLRHLDAFVIAKAEVASYPLINKGAELTGVIYVNRDSKESRNSVREKIVETVQQGFNVLVFPEGTVGLKKQTLEFRSGTFYELAENKIPCVPIALEYRNEKDLWSASNFLLVFLNQFSKWKTEVKLRIGQAYTNEDGACIKDYAYQWINDELGKMQNNWSQIDFSKYENQDPMYRYKNL